MIELVSEARCTECGLCIRVCPTNVFDDHAGLPVIARQDDCQTCYICEAYCPVDALYVAPYGDEPVAVDEDALAAAGTLGSWRATIGWGRKRPTMAALDTTPFIDRILPSQPELPAREIDFILGRAPGP
ncbi:4Fe-4S dicluster domain-containing protein [Thauera linaloolentis]|uniref:4Fe-4S ferredoxin n=1 Tax=Thauera linaloolentis (strain DSM 12138 / JCM 21573 / CCUG 41526 / CIP 105981 / IAM 15112 / NBRC 102519 / 47Lol) TaxID=1123367 RepID=N6YNR9_THAL4|nr:ferredoxin family protein [Thauera linaloolentis]ENO83982.1 4Fe-4S ferredoxin [Thauera linaloolentis 47Lol = DSM 12138]MCM8564237.1 ferredoxin family protein [Thauera linaloolentis]